MEIELDNVLMKALPGVAECVGANLAGEAFVDLRQFNLICLKGISSSLGKTPFVRVGHCI